MCNSTIYEHSTRILIRFSIESNDTNSLKYLPVKTGLWRHFNLSPSNSVISHTPTTSDFLWLDNTMGSSSDTKRSPHALVPLEPQGPPCSSPGSHRCRSAPLRPPPSHLGWRWSSRRGTGYTPPPYTNTHLINTGNTAGPLERVKTVFKWLLITHFSLFCLHLFL